MFSLIWQNHLKQIEQIPLEIDFSFLVIEVAYCCSFFGELILLDPEVNDPSICVEQPAHSLLYCLPLLFVKGIAIVLIFDGQALRLLYDLFIQKTGPAAKGSILMVFFWLDR